MTNRPRRPARPAGTAGAKRGSRVPGIAGAKRDLGKLLAAEPGFVGVGVGANPEGKPEIVVYVESARSRARRRVPGTWAGFPVRTEVIGKPIKLAR